MVKQTTCPASKLLPTFAQAETQAQEIFENCDMTAAVTFETQEVGFITIQRDGIIRRSTPEEKGWC